MSLLFAVGGFILRFFPDIAKWVGNILEGWNEDRREERRLNLMIRIEDARWKARKEEKVLDSQLQEALLKLTSEMKEIENVVKDRASARDFGTKMISNMDHTLSRGKELEVAPWLRSFGWWGTLAIEGWSALMQPLIATLIMLMWCAWKGAIIGAALEAKQDWTVAIMAAWGIEDWFLMEGVIGFYLAGRVIKQRNLSTTNTVIKG